MDKMKMSPPWIQYCNMIDAMFGLDPEIKVLINDDGRNVKLFVDNPKKADAISQLLPSEKVIGNEKVCIEVIPGDTQVKRDSLFETAFAGNPAFSYAKTVDEVFTNPITYVVFAKKVVQYWNDNLGDVNGNISTLYQNIARDLFENCDGVCFCTDNKNE